MGVVARFSTARFSAEDGDNFTRNLISVLNGDRANRALFKSVETMVSIGELPVTIEELEAALGISCDDCNDRMANMQRLQLNTIIRGTIAQVENMIKRSLSRKQLRFYYDNAMGDIYPPFGPHYSFDRVSTWDSNEQAFVDLVPDKDFEGISGEGGYLSFKGVGERITIETTSGYLRGESDTGDLRDDCPADIKMALLNIMVKEYETRGEGRQGITGSALSILSKYVPQWL